MEELKKSRQFWWETGNLTQKQNGMKRGRALFDNSMFYKQMVDIGRYLLPADVTFDEHLIHDVKAFGNGKIIPFILSNFLCHFTSNLS